MTDKEVVHVLTVLQGLYKSVMAYRVEHHHGLTWCKFCGTDQGNWVEDDPTWIPSHTDECLIGRALAILQKYPEREDK